MFQVNPLVSLFALLGLVLLYLGATGRYAGVWRAITAIPLTPAQAAQQAAQASAPPSEPMNRIG
jgi:hypothetical protein